MKIETRLFHVRYKIFRKCCIHFQIKDIVQPAEDFLLPNIGMYVVYAEFPVGSNFHFSQWKIYFSQFIFLDKYLKFEEIEYLIHQVKFEMWPAFILCKLSLFSTVNLELGHRFSQFILRLIIEIFECWFLVVVGTFS